VDETGFMLGKKDSNKLGALSRLQQTQVMSHA
jgi:hypothetical protein